MYSLLDVDSQRSTSSHKRKVGIAIIGGSCLVLLSVIAMSVSNPKAESTSLFAVPTSFQRAGSMLPMAMPSGSSCQPQIQRAQDTLKSHGFGPSPFQKLALASVAKTRNVCTAADLGILNEHALEAGVGVTAALGLQQLTLSKKEPSALAKSMPGITAPTGYFDPLGFSTTVDDETLVFYRECELKHGRVGMLAFLGFVLGETLSPLIGGPANMPAVNVWEETTQDIFWPWVIIATAVHEMQALYVQDEKGQWVNRVSEVPGDIGWDPLGLKPKDPKAFLEMQNKELNNGRLAMLAAAGIIAQEQVYGTKLFR